MATIGEVAVKLGLNSDEFMKNIDKVESECKQLEKNLDETKASFEKMSKAMAGTENPSKEMIKVFNQLKSELKKDQTAFNDFDNKLKKFEGGLLKGKNNIDLLKGALGKLVAGGSIIALGKQMIDFSKQSVAAFREQDRAIKNLNLALQNAGVYTEEYASHLQTLASEIQSFSNYGDEAVAKAIGLGQAYSGNIKLTDELIKATVDYAAATETDLQTAFTLVGKSIGTSTNALARYGVSLDQNMSKEEKMAVITETLQQRFNGSAVSMSDSSVKLKNSLGDLSEAFGKWLNPSVEKTQNILQKGVEKLTNWINHVRALRGEIASLSKDELDERLTDINKKINRFKDQKTYTIFGANSSQFKNLLKEREEILKQMEKLNQQTAKAEKASKENYVPLAETSKSTNTTGSKTDKALEEYKKFIEEYTKLNDNYAATLKARQYVEGTLNINPVTQQEEYNKLVTLYQNHLSKIAEIARSGAKNKAEIEKLEEEKLAQDLQEYRVTKEQETQRKIAEIIKGYNETAAGIDTNAGVGVSFLSGLSEQYKAKLDLEKWYQEERKKIIKESNGDIQLQQNAFAQLDILKTKKEVATNLATWQEYGNKVSNILGNSFSSILSGQESFGDAMKSLLGNLYSEMIKMLFDEVMKEIELEKALAAAKMALRAITSSIGGFFGGIGGAISGLFTHHSGGMIPGTKEQVAVLQGGERVLNRSEAANYNNNEATGNGDVNNVMVFNIKAWDGRDVIDTLKANSNTINQIVSSGIKNNNQNLRTIVQNT